MIIIIFIIFINHFSAVEDFIARIQKRAIEKRKEMDLESKAEKAKSKLLPPSSSLSYYHHRHDCRHHHHHYLSSDTSTSYIVC